MSIPAQRSPNSERGLVSEAQHRIASAPITLIKKGTLPPGALPYWAVSDVPFFRVSFSVKKCAKNPKPGKGGNLIPVLLQFSQVLEESKMNLLAQAFFRYFPLLTKGVTVKQPRQTE